MRLGSYPCVLKSGSLAHQIYGKPSIQERHRHRWEVNNTYREQCEKAGMVMSGTSPDNSLVEIVEVADHPWFVGVQFHPEFLSGPLFPHPLFTSFIGAALKNRARAEGEKAGTAVKGEKAVSRPKGELAEQRSA